MSPVSKVHLLFEGFDRLLRPAGSGKAQQLPILPGDFAWGADTRHEALHWEITLCTGEVGPSLRAVLPVQQHHGGPKRQGEAVEQLDSSTILGVQKLFRLETGGISPRKQCFPSTFWEFFLVQKSRVVG